MNANHVMYWCRFGLSVNMPPPLKSEDFERWLSLPFVPYPGLDISFDDEEDPYRIKHVTWFQGGTPDKSFFSCDLRAMDFSDRNPVEFENEIEWAAEYYKDDGWSIWDIDAPDCPPEHATAKPEA